MDDFPYVESVVAALDIDVDVARRIGQAYWGSGALLLPGQKLKSKCQGCVFSVL